jgi:predicted protein tyrosine phosphatase
MPTLHICPLSQLHTTVTTAGARSIITLLNAGTAVRRPAEVEPERHILIAISDITEPMDGHILPGAPDVASLLAFVRQWDRRDPMVIHCFAGVSRSTAAAFITACALSPNRDERDVAGALRAASPTATPNVRLIALADQMLSRNGRMVAAIEAIGRGLDCLEAAPFRLDLR